MKIEALRPEKEGDRTRVAATVKWENCERSSQDIYFETNELFAESLTCNPHAFLLACAVPAMHYGEERVFIDEEICPELRDGLMTALGWLQHWYYEPDHKVIQIEAKTRSSIPTYNLPQRAGAFFSGGIDSLALIRGNRFGYPAEHPGSIKDVLMVYGQNVESDMRPETFEQAMSALTWVTQEADITLIPVSTNIRDLDTDTEFFVREFHGVILAAIGHAFTQRFSAISVASTYDIPNLSPWGSHPFLDQNYSSSDLRIRHDDLRLSRLEKVKLVAEWDIALQNIRVCGPNWPGMNCGKCEKCVRTMLELLVLGVLDRTRSFPGDNVSPELVQSAVKITNSYTMSCYQELIVPLQEQGRLDLVQAIERKIEWYHRGRDGSVQTWRSKVRRFDQKFLNGRLTKLRRMIS